MSLNNKNQLQKYNNLEDVLPLVELYSGCMKPWKSRVWSRDLLTVIQPKNLLYNFLFFAHFAIFNFPEVLGKAIPKYDDSVMIFVPQLYFWFKAFA